MEVVGEYLDDTVHQVKLGDRIFAVDHLFQHLGQDSFSVPFLGDAVQVRKPDEVRANQQLQLLALLLPLLFLLDFTLGLHADPKSVPTVSSIAITVSKENSKRERERERARMENREETLTGKKYYVHFAKILQDKLDGVVGVATLSGFVLAT